MSDKRALAKLAGLVIAPILLLAAVVFLEHKPASAANEIVGPCVWEATCDGSHPDGGVWLKPTSSQCATIPHNSFAIGNVTETGANNAAVVYIGVGGLGSASMNVTTKGHPIPVGVTQPIDSDPALWFCKLPPDAGSETVELIGGSR